MDTSDAVDASDREPDEAVTRAPSWTLAVLLGLWVLGVLALFRGRERVAAAAIVSTLPVLWYDAYQGKRRGDLGIGRPVTVPVVVALFWIVALPVYVLLRVAHRVM